MVKEFKKKSTLVTRMRVSFFVHRFYPSRALLPEIVRRTYAEKMLFPVGNVNEIPLPTWLVMLTRATSKGMLKTLTNKRIGELLTSKLTRETY